MAVSADDYAQDACIRVAKASRDAGEPDPALMLSIGQAAAKSSYIEVNVRGMVLLEYAQKTIAAKGRRDEASRKERMITAAIQMTAVCEYVGITRQ
ncbi:hypothetical protein ACPFP2_25860 [Micromonospora citrea]|uniref:hypothetical protein n=1 Tax=Micromonospora citrea TaxID=47855 RepID=UPI003C3BEF26